MASREPKRGPDVSVRILPSHTFDARRSAWCGVIFAAALAFVACSTPAAAGGFDGYPLPAESSLNGVPSVSIPARWMRGDGSRLFEKKISRFLPRFGTELIPVMILLHEPLEVRRIAGQDGFDDPRRLGWIQAAAQEFSRETLREGFLPWHGLTHLPVLLGELPPESATRIAQHPLVRFIQPIGVVRPARIEAGQLMRAANGAGTLETKANGRGSGVVVAIIDTGIATAGTQGDLTEADIIERRKYTVAKDDVGPTDDDADASDSNWHGTRVAQIIAGQTAGMAKDALLWDMEAIPFGIPEEEDNEFSPAFPVLLALHDLLVARIRSCAIDVVNMSISIGPAADRTYDGNCDGVEPIFAEIADALVARGVTLIAATGNEGENGLADDDGDVKPQGISLPACLSSVISVGAVYDADLEAPPGKSLHLPGGCDQPGGSTKSCTCAEDLLSGQDKVFEAEAFRKAITCYSNFYDGETDVFAPGDFANVPSGNDTNVPGFGGTSSASAYASGVAAQLKSRNPTKASPANIRQAFKQCLPAGGGGCENAVGGLPPGPVFIDAITADTYLAGLPDAPAPSTGGWEVGGAVLRSGYDCPTADCNEFDSVDRAYEQEMKSFQKFVTLEITGTGLATTTAPSPGNCQTAEQLPLIEIPGEGIVVHGNAELQVGNPDCKVPDRLYVSVSSDQWDYNDFDECSYRVERPPETRPCMDLRNDRRELVTDVILKREPKPCAETDCRELPGALRVKWTDGNPRTLTPSGFGLCRPAGDNTFFSASFVVDGFNFRDNADISLVYQSGPVRDIFVRAWEQFDHCADAPPFSARGAEPCDVWNDAGGRDSSTLVWLEGDFDECAESGETTYVVEVDGKSAADVLHVGPFFRVTWDSTPTQRTMNPGFGPWWGGTRVRIDTDSPIFGSGGRLIMSPAGQDPLTTGMSVNKTIETSRRLFFDVPPNTIGARDIHFQKASNLQRIHLGVFRQANFALVPHPAAGEIEVVTEQDGFELDRIAVAGTPVAVEIFPKGSLGREAFFVQNQSSSTGLLGWIGDLARPGDLTELRVPGSLVEPQLARASREGRYLAIQYSSVNEFEVLENKLTIFDLGTWSQGGPLQAPVTQASFIEGLAFSRRTGPSGEWLVGVSRNVGSGNSYEVAFWFADLNPTSPSYLDLQGPVFFGVPWVFETPFPDVAIVERPSGVVVATATGLSLVAGCLNDLVSGVAQPQVSSIPLDWSGQLLDLEVQDGFSRDGLLVLREDVTIPAQVLEERDATTLAVRWSRPMKSFAYDMTRRAADGRIYLSTAAPGGELVVEELSSFGKPLSTWQPKPGAAFSIAATARLSVSLAQPRLAAGNDVEVTFWGGSAEVSSTLVAAPANLPADFVPFPEGQVYDITGSNEGGPVTVCIVPQGEAPNKRFELRLLHEEDGTFVDRTTHTELATGEICGTVDSFSLFAVGYSAREDDDPDGDEDQDDNGGGGSGGHGGG